MEAIEFAKKLSEAKTSPSIERWADKFQESIVLQATGLVGQLDRLPPDLRVAYWQVIGAMLRTSDLRHYVIRSETKNSLMESAPDDIRPLIAQRFLVGV
jgi:hypothetical protein